MGENVTFIQLLLTEIKKIKKWSLYNIKEKEIKFTMCKEKNSFQIQTIQSKQLQIKLKDQYRTIKWQY